MKLQCNGERQDANYMTGQHTSWKEAQRIHFLFESNPSSKKRITDSNNKVGYVKSVKICQGEKEENTSNKIIEEIQKTLCLCQWY